MQIPSVENFLFCFRLETGAKVLGWISGVISAIGFFVSTFMFGFAAFNYPGLLNATMPEHQAQIELLEKSRFSK